MRMNTLNGVWSGGTPEVEGHGGLKGWPKSEKSHQDKGDYSFSDPVGFPANEVDCGENASSQPQQPHFPKPPSLMKTNKSLSLDATVRRRRLKGFTASQESLTDRTGTGSSSESLQDDTVGLSVCGNAIQSPNRQWSLDESLTDKTQEFQDRGGRVSEPERKSSKQHNPMPNCTASSKVRLSPLQPSGPLPAVEMCAASTSLRTANHVDTECLDYRAARSEQSERLHRNLSDSRLLESTVSDSASLSSMRSTFSVLNPIRPKDVRNRSFLEGSVMGHGALLGSEELDRYFPDRRLGIYIATWNMQGEKGLPTNLDDLLLPTDSEFAQDFYVIGVQEGCADRREWDIRLQETLGPYYVMLYTATHGVLYLSVFIRRDLIWFCSEVEHATVTTRIISQIKTKGAVGVGLTFFGTSFLFLNSHFTSGDLKVYERILDYKKIIEALALPRSLPDTNPYRSTASDVTTRFDEVFWFGDFNFRLSKDRAGVDAILKEELQSDMGPLLQYDQLMMKMNEGSIFNGFQEAPIHFLPTYKFDIGCDVYDTTSKKRIPSYTDRILYRSRQKDDVSVVKYTSCPSIKTSDHRPVIGIFQVKIRPGRDNIPLGAGQFDRELYLEGIRRRITRELERREAMKSQKNSAVCSVS